MLRSIFIANNCPIVREDRFFVQVSLRRHRLSFSEILFKRKRDPNQNTSGLPIHPKNPPSLGSLVLFSPKSDRRKKWIRTKFFGPWQLFGILRRVQLERKSFLRKTIPFPDMFDTHPNPQTPGPCNPRGHSVGHFCDKKQQNDRDQLFCVASACG